MVNAVSSVCGFFLELADVFYNPYPEVVMSDLGRVVSVYSLFDRKLREYGPLVVERNDESVVRALLDGIRGSKSVMELHPEDFDLFYVGSYNCASGGIVGSQGELFAPRLVGNVAALMESSVS